MKSKNLLKRTLSLAASAAMSASLVLSALSAAAVNTNTLNNGDNLLDIDDNCETSQAATVAIAASAQAVVTAATNSNNYVVLHIEQQAVDLDELIESDYQVSVRVYATGAQYGIDSWNSKFLCYTDCTPEGYNEIWTESYIHCGGAMSLDKKTGIESDNFNITVGALTNNPTGIVQVNGYSSETIYNDNLTDEVGGVTFFTLTFTLPENTCSGDFFNIIWWDEKNIENRNSMISGDSVSYSTFYDHGFIRITSDNDTPDDECVDITCEEEHLGFFYAEDQTALSLQNCSAQALLYDGTVIDISADCTLKTQASPYALYWDAYNAGNATFNFRLDIVYCGNDSNIIAYCDKNGYTIGSVGLTIGQRGDANLDHAPNNYDSAEITKYIADMQEYEISSAFGSDAAMPLLCSGSKLAVFLADCSGDGKITTIDTALLSEWEVLSVRYSIMQNYTPDELCTLWAQILNAA